MNYLLIPFFALIIAILQRHLTQSASCKRIRENNLVMWNITLLFSLLGAIISYQIYRYELTAPLSMGQVMILTLYLLLTLLFVAVSPSGFRRLFLKRTYSEEELLNLMKKLSEIDLKIKTVDTNPNQEIELFIINI